MKKIVTVIVLAALVLSLAACGALSGKEVAVLWADGGKTVNPNSMQNAMDRALYIEHITYTYYGAEGNAQTQIAQAEAAVKAGCAALMVQAVDAEAAAACVELAKANSIPVVLFGTKLDEAVLAGYEKAVLVITDEATLVEKQTEMITKYLEDKKVVKNLDRNQDGKLTVINRTESQFTFELENVVLDIVDGGVENVSPSTAEMVITANDEDARNLLLQLQALDFNTDKLATHYVALFTVGNSVDYKTLVLKDAPAEGEARLAHFEDKKFLCDLTTVAAEDLEEIIYTTVNVVDSGRITRTAMEDYDAVSEAAAAAVAALLTGKTTEQTQLIPYTIYGD